MKTTLILFALSILLWSCKDCGDTSSEVKIRLEFNDAVNDPVFDKIIALGANRDVSLVKTVPKNSGTPHYYVPIQSNGNSTTYYFYRPGRTDTLVIGYERKVVFTSNECGFSMNFENFEIEKNTLSSSAGISDGRLSGLLSLTDGFDPYIEFFE